MPVRSWCGPSLHAWCAPDGSNPADTRDVRNRPAASGRTAHAVFSVGTGLFPLGNIGLGDRLDRQDFLLRQRLAVEVVCDHPGCFKPSARGDLRAGAVLLARLDPGDALLEAIAADDDQLALL